MAEGDDAVSSTDVIIRYAFKYGGNILFGYSQNAQHIIENTYFF